MTLKGECVIYLVAVAFLCLALLISICFNIIFIIKVRRKSRGTCEYRLQPTDEDVPRSQNQRPYSYDLDNEDREEHPNAEQQQDNPIYGNIGAESSVVCYETMTAKQPRRYSKMTDPDLNYASLDLKAAKKRRQKQRRQYGHENPLDQPDQLNACSEADEDVDARLPPRDASIMVSHSSIYLNSQQLAQETEERERSVNIERDPSEWDGEEESQHGEAHEWETHDEVEKREDELSEGEGEEFAHKETTQN